MSATFRSRSNTVPPPLSPRRATLRRQRILDRSCLAIVIVFGVASVAIWFA